MGGPCPYSAWMCRPAWPVFVFLASISCVSRCDESPAVVVGKMYPRGNHWAVGHLMGKKSIEILPALQNADQDSGYLPASETADASEPSPFEGLLEALLEHKSQKQTPRQASDRLWLHGGWREEDQDKYLREISDLLLLAMKTQDADSD